MRRWIVLAAVLALALVAASCGGGGEDEGGTVKLGGQNANDHGTEDASGKDTLSFEMDDFYFEPTVIQGEAGQTLTLEVENEGENAHTFTSDELGVDEVVQPGEEAEIEIMFPDSGQVVFECRFHASQGMRGAVEVAS